MGLWYESVYKGFLTACTIIFLLSFGFTGETQFNAMITGYSLMIISISLIMIVLIAKISSSSQNNSISSSILSALLNTGPFVIMLILACIIVYIQIN